MITIVTLEGDYIDALIADHYGIAETVRALDAVMAANQGLAEWGPILPGGLVIVFPDLPAAEPALRLWD